MRRTTFRLDVCSPLITDARVKEFLAKHTGSHCVAFELADKTKKAHYQGWIDVELNHQNLGNLVKKEFPEVKEGAAKGRGKGHYSVAPIRKSIDEVHRYTCKGTVRLMPKIVSSQFTVEEHDTFADFKKHHDDYWAIWGDVVDKKRQGEVVMRGIEHFKNYEYVDNSFLTKRYAVAEWLSKEYAGKGKNSFLFKNYINGILTETCEAYNREFCRQIAESDRW